MTPAAPATDPDALLEAETLRVSELIEEVASFDREIAAIRAGAERRVAKLERLKSASLQEMGAAGQRIEELIAGHPELVGDPKGGTAG